MSDEITLPSKPTFLLPNKWTPRDYQLKLWRYLQGGGKRAVAVWHRRAGKDDLALHWTAMAANDLGHSEAIGRVGSYWHMLPEATQARKAVWDAVNPVTGKRRIDEAFPEWLRESTRETDMMIKFRTGSTWQVVGSDNYNSLVGSPPIGVVFSEWAIADPAAWAYIRPILAENGGWALFIYTPRGQNHGSKFYENARVWDGWFAEKLPASSTDVFSPETLAQEQRELVAEYGEGDGKIRYRQEYECDFQASIIGSYYGHEMELAQSEGRITDVPWDSKYPVETAWDLGRSDSTAIWFFQRVGLAIRAIDYLENHGVGIDYYLKALKEKPYTYGHVSLPHDAKPIKDLTADKSVLDVLQAHGYDCTVLPQHSISDGINEGRRLIGQTSFDAKKCERGIECLKNYRREWDDDKKVYADKPRHDWASHGSDSWRYAAMHSPVDKDFYRPIKYGPLPITMRGGYRSPASGFHRPLYSSRNA